jgi:hypothetical protein
MPAKLVLPREFDTGLREGYNSQAELPAESAHRLRNNFLSAGARGALLRESIVTAILIGL